MLHTLDTDTVPLGRGTQDALSVLNLRTDHHNIGLGKASLYTHILSINVDRVSHTLGRYGSQELGLDI